ncbi:MAG: hypothetical protein JSV85_01590 [Candidatus Bathyarchaeota archaeon]|nr:MAG: hypothetical protein JSV85_01590 [Candidatus Bathyarchaeota archaeon]
MTEKEDEKTFLEKAMPRVLKAAVVGITAFFLYYLLPTLLFSMLPTESLPPEFGSFFSRYENLVYVFAGIMICFAVAIQLSSGTVFKHVFSIAKAIIVMLYLIFAFDGGLLALNLPVEETVVGLEANLTTFLTILILVNLLSLAKSMLEMISFFSRKAEQSLTEVSGEEETVSMPELK